MSLQGWPHDNSCFLVVSITKNLAGPIGIEVPYQSTHPRDTSSSQLQHGVASFQRRKSVLACFYPISLHLPCIQGVLPISWSDSLFILRWVMGSHSTYHVAVFPLEPSSVIRPRNRSDFPCGLLLSGYSYPTSTCCTRQNPARAIAIGCVIYN